MKITDTMVLAFAKKELEVEGRDMDIEYDIEYEIPYTEKPIRMKVKSKIGSYTIKVTDGFSET